MGSWDFKSRGGPSARGGFDSHMLPPSLGRLGWPVIVGTAGHVDHGKTTLVKALTGVDTDRLPEEKAREISIEIGFAPLALPGGHPCSIVDVPGHERFIKNMLAGATGVDVALLVVDAAEGVRPQTREHLDILGLLGVRGGVAALTKTDTVTPNEAARAAEDLAAFLAGTSLAGCPVVSVSARTGEGLAELRRALADVVARVAAGRAEGEGGVPARLAVDRAFLAPGFGTVVTGTVAAGRIAADDTLQVYPSGPLVRVRRLEVHGRQVPEVRAGQRAALNLAGAPKGLELRGRVLASPGSLEAADAAGLRLRLLPGVAPLRDFERVRLHAGTAEILGRVTLLDETEGARKELEPGTEAIVAFETEGSRECAPPLALAPGQPFIIRTYSPPRTVAGGTVAVPNLTAALGGRPRGREARRRAARLVAERAASPTRPRLPGGFGPATLLGAKTDSGRAEGVRLMAGGQYAAEEPFYQAIKAEVARRLREQHEAQPHLASVGREALWSWLEGRDLPPAVWLETLAEDGLIVLDRGRVRLATWTPRRPEGLEAAMRALASALLAGGFSPPSLAGAAANLRAGGILPASRAAGTPAGPETGLLVQALEVLALDGTVVCPTGLAGALAGDPAFHRQVVETARRRLEEHLARRGEITVAEFRDLIGSSRKYALPLLEHFDREKVTQRRGDSRVRHPSRSGEGPE